MKLIVTIDTEEDNWGSYHPTDYTVENIERIPELQRLFDDFNVKPTYLVTYSVASDEKGSAVLEKILDAGKCEIGAHCHPWNTPPFEETPGVQNSMLSNLPADLQFRKLSVLHRTIQDRFKIDPVSFRSGRWGYNQAVARNIARLGYKIDSSITPYMDWGCYDGPDFSTVSPRPYRFSDDNIFREEEHGPLLEVPATVGYFQDDFEACNRLLMKIRRKPLALLKIEGILSRLRLLNKVWLSPEFSDAKSMIKLTERLMKKQYPVINLFFHSPTLKRGLTSFVQTEGDEKRFLARIREFLIFARDFGIESIKLSDSLGIFHPNGPLPAPFSKPLFQEALPEQGTGVSSSFNEKGRI